jgi:hypothetical protein
MSEPDTGRVLDRRSPSLLLTDHPASNEAAAAPLIEVQVLRECRAVYRPTRLQSRGRELDPEPPAAVQRAIRGQVHNGEAVAIRHDDLPVLLRQHLRERRANGRTRLPAVAAPPRRGSPTSRASPVLRPLPSSDVLSCERTSATARWRTRCR